MRCFLKGFMFLIKCKKGYETARNLITETFFELKLKRLNRNTVSMKRNRDLFNFRPSLFQLIRRCFNYILDIFITYSKTFFNKSYFLAFHITRQLKILRRKWCFITQTNSEGSEKAKAQALNTHTRGLEKVSDKEPHLWLYWSHVTREPVFGACDQVRFKVKR